MIGLPNPYVLAGGAVGTLVIGASLYIQSTLIHKYHALYDCAEFALSCPKDTENIPHLKTVIGQMTTAQNTQIGKSEGNIIKVIQGPREVQSIIREIDTAKAAGPCLPPADSDEVKNAF